MTDPAEIRKAWNEKSEQTAEPFRSALLSLPDDAVIWSERLAQWPTVAWDNKQGTVTLAGDAAHPMTYRKHKAYPPPTLPPAPHSSPNLAFPSVHETNQPTNFPNTNPRPRPRPQQRRPRRRQPRPRAKRLPRQRHTPHGRARMLRGRSRQTGPRGRPFVRAELGHGARLGAVDGFAAIPAWGGGAGGEVDGWWGFWISDRDIVVVVFSFSWLQNALVKPFCWVGERSDGYDLAGDQLS